MGCKMHTCSFNAGKVSCILLHDEYVTDTLSLFIVIAVSTILQHRQPSSFIYGKLKYIYTSFLHKEQSWSRG